MRHHVFVLQTAAPLATGLLDHDLLLDQALEGLDPLERYCDALTAFGLGRFQLNIGIKIAIND